MIADTCTFLAACTYSAHRESALNAARSSIYEREVAQDVQLDHCWAMPANRISTFSCSLPPPLTALQSFNSLFQSVKWFFFWAICYLTHQPCLLTNGGGRTAVRMQEVVALEKMALFLQYLELLLTFCMQLWSKRKPSIPCITNSVTTLPAIVRNSEPILLRMLSQSRSL